MQYFPCPNGNCRYQFDTSMLPPAAMVTCPLCGVRFPYRAGQPIPTLAPPGNAPQPVQRYAPAAEPEPERQSESDHPSDMSMSVREAPVVRRRVQPTGSGSSTWIMVGIFTLFMVAGLFVVANMLKNKGFHNRDGGPKDTRQVQEDLNLVIDVKDPSWKYEDEWRSKLAANLCYKKEDAEAYIAIYAEDYKDRTPRPGEVRKLMEQRLLRVFDKETLEMQDREGDFKWGGKPATAVIFQGTPPDSETIYKGECYLMIHQGIGYVYFGFASLDEHGPLEASLADLRKSFVPGTLRNNWQEKISNVTTFALKDGAFQVQDRDGVWINREVDEEGRPLSKKGAQYAIDAKQLDPMAVMALIAEMDRRKTFENRMSFTPTCEALVLQLEKGDGEALEQAKSYLLDHYQKEADKSKVEGVPAAKFSLQEVKKSPSETPIPKSGAPTDRAICLDSQNPSHQRLLVYSAQEIDGKLFVVFCHCSMTNAPYMEPYMLRLASSLKKQ